MRPWPVVPLGGLLTKSEEWVKLDPLATITQVRVQWWGQGAVVRKTATAAELGSDKWLSIRWNQFLISRIDARKGAAGIVPRNLHGAFVSNDFPAFNIDTERLEPQFLDWYSKTARFVEDCNSASEGTTNRVRLKEDRFSAMRVPLPPLEEQRRIVGRIEALNEKIKNTRQISGQLEEARRKLWMVLARECLIRIGAAHPTPLKELVTLIGGGTPSKGNPEFWQGKFPWVSPKDMKRRTIRDSADHISDSAINGSAAKLIEPGAVLIVVRGMILAHTVPSAVLAVPATINQDMKALVPRSGLSPEFLSMYLWAFNTELLALVERSTHDTRKLETKNLLGFPVVVPPPDVQEAVCNKLRQLEDQVNQIAGHRRAAMREIEALMPSILNQAFSGQL